MADVTVQAESATITLATGAGTVTALRDATHPEPGLPSGVRPGFTGTGYIDFGDDPGDKLTFAATVATAGTYTLEIRYASQSYGGQPRSLLLDVNGGTAVSTVFPNTGPTSGANAGFNTWGVLTLQVTLQAGQNTIGLAIPPGVTAGPNIDEIGLTLVSGDTSADADANPLFLSGPTGPLSGAAAASINFNVTGRDSDIVKTEISFDGGTTKTVVLPDADGDFVANGSGLAAGTYQATVIVTDAAGNTAQTAMQIVVEGSTGGGTFPLTVEAESFTIVDADNDTLARTHTQNQEPGATAGNSGPGLTYDSFGLRPGYGGTGYLDMGNDVGDRGSFQVTTESGGTYELAVRYALGATASRPMTVVVGTTSYTIDLTPTGSWSTWATATVSVRLEEGANTVSFANSIANGPNLDNVTVTAENLEPRDEIYFEPVAKINFQPAPGTGGLPGGFTTPAGYLADTGAAYGNRGNGFTYGWVTEGSVADGTANGTTPSALVAGSVVYDANAAGASSLQRTIAQFELGGSSRAWEMALANGSYEVKISVGDTSGAFGPNYALNVEGLSVMPDWSPANPGGQGGTTGGLRSSLVTAIVEVNDGKLTIDSIGGANTEIQSIEIESIPDLTPTNGQPADLDYSYFSAPVADSLSNGQVSIAIGPNGQLPTGIDPTSTLVVGVVLRGTDYRGPNIVYTDNVKLVETVTGIEVPVAVQISGGADSLNVRPLSPLNAYTSYTLKVEDVLDLGSFSDPDAPLRQMQDLTTTFVTGAQPVTTTSSVAFDTVDMLNGFADGAAGYTSVDLGPDGKLYVATITGEISRWSLNGDGTINKSTKETLTLPYLDAGNGERRGIVGFEFDPTDPNTIWITDNAPIPRQSTAFTTPEFSGRVSKISLGAGGSFTGATAEAYISGLPRSGGDHLTNSLEFRANPNAGQAGEPAYLLYLTQGSNTATGATDPAWGGRPERLLNATVLEVDPTRTAPAGGFDVRTEPVNPGDDPTTTFPASQFNADGTYPGMYNPFAANAVLKIFATGLRNGYDLVWHSNGQLYVPTNGSAAGGRTPADPTQPGFDTTLANAPKQSDFFFTVDEGKYYGHPNTLRDEYILNGGNPTNTRDPAEVVAGNDGNPSTDGYPVGVQTDPDYDLDGVYNLGPNRSPNGAVEYASTVFGTDISGTVIFAQFSVGDNLRMIKLDSSGSVVGDEVLRRSDGTVIDDYIDPLDVTMNPTTGEIYLITLNRSTGASQLVKLTPRPGTSDTTADAGGDLTLTAFNVTNPAGATFAVTGVDPDIQSLKVTFNGGIAETVTLDSQGRFTVDLRGLPSGLNNAILTVQDDNVNFAEDSTSFTLSSTEYTPLVAIQAEDRTPGDGTAVTIPTTGGAQIKIRDAITPETVVSPGMINGLHPGAFGIDGNTNNNDGTPGGYADFGNTNADFITFTFDADSTGPAVLAIRYSNGGTSDRPLQLSVNGAVVSTVAFPSTSGFANWQTIEVPTSLVAGTNTVTLRSVAGNGPNIDQLQVLTPGFSPTPAAIVDSGRIELETTSGAATTDDANSVRFFFTVASSGIYRLDTAANAGAPAGGTLSWALNDTPIEQTPFPGTGTAGEQALYASLTAGTTYELSLDSSSASGASALDYLDVTKATLSASADIGIQSQDPAYFDNRLHYNWIEDPVQDGVTRDMKVEGVVRITNTGTTTLQVLDAILDGPFVLANPTILDNRTIAPGAGVNVAVRFDRSQYTPPTTNVDGTSTVFNGKLTLVTNDQDSPVATVDLSGFWQAKWESGQEPNVNEIWQVFGFGNRIEGLSLLGGGQNSTLSTRDVYAKTDPTEILSPYWEIAPGVTTARATELAAMHGPGGAFLQIHNPGNKSQLFDIAYHASTDNQRFLPNVFGSTTAFATKTFTRDNIPDSWLGEDVFGISMAGLSTDPRLNARGGVVVPNTQQGHTVKMFQAYDADGNLLQNVWIGIQDYTGINYDYNDNIFLFEGVRPVGVGPTGPLANTYPDINGTPVSDIATQSLSAALFGASDTLI